MFILFYNYQDTESKSREIKMCVAGPISTQKIFNKLYSTIISIIYKMGEKYCGNYSYLWS